MIHKIGNVKDLSSIPNLSPEARKTLFEFANVLTQEYGEDRDINKDYGGFVLYCTSGTKVDEIKAMFDFEKYVIEFIEHTYEANPQICTIVYITSCERGAVLVMSIEDLPKEITNTF